MASYYLSKVEEFRSCRTELGSGNHGNGERGTARPHWLGLMAIGRELG